jgi:hypothetical protein
MLLLIVMRQADMAVVHPRQDDTRVCARCGEPVSIFPSGQAVLAAAPDAEIVCGVCYERGDSTDDVKTLAPGSMRDWFESVKRPRR